MYTAPASMLSFAELVVGVRAALVFDSFVYAAPVFPLVYARWFWLVWPLMIPETVLYTQSGTRLVLRTRLVCQLAFLGAVLRFRSFLGHFGHFPRRRLVAVKCIRARRGNRRRSVLVLSARLVSRLDSRVLGTESVLVPGGYPLC
jgi:hypothetical protein